MDANVDELLLLLGGLLAVYQRPTLILAGTGDGRLVESLVDGLDLAAAVRLIPARIPVATLSVPGSRAVRLRAGSQSRIAANLTIGRDCLREQLPTR